VPQGKKRAGFKATASRQGPLLAPKLRICGRQALPMVNLGDRLNRFDFFFPMI
jgi:hypothetical protein